MCHFITLVVRGKASGLAEVMRKHGRSAREIDNPSIRSVLSAGEFQYLTTSSHCDCGTVLAARQAKKADFAVEAARLRRKGWSDAKIARAMDDSQRAESRPTKHVDSLAFWAAVIKDVAALSDAKGIGLLVHGYSGDVGAEAFQVSRRNVAAADLANALSDLREDELLFAET